MNFEGQNIMIIKHKIDDFFFKIFPELENIGNSKIAEELGKYYLYEGFAPPNRY